MRRRSQSLPSARQRQLATTSLAGEIDLNEPGLRIKVFRSILARLLFMAHGLATVWRAAVDEQRNFYIYGFALPIVLMFLDAGIRILFFEANESRWFCVSIFLYLSAVIPSIWTLQLHPISNSTSVEQLNFIVNLPFEARRDEWISVLEQSLLVVLIVGRWILPRGRISRNHLSQLLLVWMAIGADIIDLFDVLKQTSRLSEKAVQLILTVWTVSLFQFTITFTTKSRRIRSVLVRNKSEGTFHSDSQTPNAQVMADTLNRSVSPINRSLPLILMKNVEIWSILTTILLQDGPFLGVRLYLVIVETHTSYTMIYYTCKNTLVVFLQLYRLYGIVSKIVEDHRLKKALRKL